MLLLFFLLTGLKYLPLRSCVWYISIGGQSVAYPLVEFVSVVSLI